MTDGRLAVWPLSHRPSCAQRESFNQNQDQEQSNQKQPPPGPETGPNHGPGPGRGPGPGPGRGSGPKPRTITMTTQMQSRGEERTRTTESEKIWPERSKSAAGALKFNIGCWVTEHSELVVGKPTRDKMIHLRSPA
jgi:hypothetical protein